MKYLLIAVALLVVGLIAFVMTRKPEPITEVVATYDGNPEEYNGNKTLLVAVHAKWASVWRATAEVLANLDTEQYDIKLLNADEDRDAVKALGVDIIPTVIVFKDGAEIARLPNMMNANQLP